MDWETAARGILAMVAESEASSEPLVEMRENVAEALYEDWLALGKGRYETEPSWGDVSEDTRRRYLGLADKASLAVAKAFEKFNRKHKTA